MQQYLVVAHQTAVSPELVDLLQAKMAVQHDLSFTLLVPATPVNHLLVWSEGETQEIAARRATEALEDLRRESIPVSASKVGVASPVAAVADELRQHPDAYSGIIISTHQPGISRWLGLGVVDRIRRTTNLPVFHVTAGTEQAVELAVEAAECKHVEVEPYWADEDGERYFGYRCVACGKVLDYDVARRFGAWRP
jgi:CheY-like chemotaxis protein